MKSREIIVDTDYNTCGACSIYSIICHYGGYIPLNTIVDDTMTDKNGTNAYLIVRALKKYGFDSYGLNTKISNINSNLLPVIGHVNKGGYNHFIVIYKINEKNMVIMDPSSGKKVLSIDEFNKIYTGVIITAIPQGKIVKYNKENIFFKEILSIIKSNKIYILLSISMSIIIYIISLIFSAFIKINKYISLSALIVLLLFKCLLIFIKNNIDLNTSINIEYNIKNRFIKYLFNLKSNYIKNKRTGELIKKIDNLDQIKSFIMEFVLVYMVDLLILIMSFIVIYNISFKISIIITLIYIIYILLYYISKNRVYIYNKDYLDEGNNYSSILFEYISNIENIKSLKNEEYFFNKITKQHKKYLSNIKIYTMFVCKLDILKVLIRDIIILFIYLNYKLFLIEDLIIYMGIIGIINNYLDNLINIIPSYINSKAVFRATNEFFLINSTNTHKLEIKSFKSLKIRNLSYTYDYFKYIINNLNYTICFGDKILIQGSSGKGKSTLAKCISGLIDDYTGNIYIDDNDIRKCNANIIYVGQNETLFNTTIKENITLGNGENDLNKIIDICYLNHLIHSKKNNIDSMILEGASNISQGEKARIILARALYKNPDILILDETLSNLNKELEIKILHNLLNDKKITLIYISHRNNEKYFKKKISL